MRYYAPEQLSHRMAKTPEGFLLCYDVPVARVGSQDYAPEEIAGLETPIPPGPNGMIAVARTAEELFREETLATLNGKDVVDEHPDEDEERMFDVDPDNWRYVTRGTVLNPRRGAGADADVILCDLLIKDAATIKEVEARKREVSGGYRAQYFKLGPGLGEQRNIFFNHVALVEAGRCGPRCSIRDHQCNSKEQSMATKSWKDRLLAAFKTKDEEGFLAAMKEAPKTADDEVDPAAALTSTNGVPEVHIHNHMGPGPAGADLPPGTAKLIDDDDNDGEQLPGYFKKHVADNDAKFQAVHDSLDELKGMLKGQGGAGDTVDAADPNKGIADELEQEAPEGVTKDHARKARDSANLEHGYQLMVADSEVILPGVSVPVFTRDAAPTVTYPAMCKHRRTVLELAYVQPATRGMIDEILAGKSLDLAGLPCAKVRDMFSSLATARRAANRAGAFTDDGRRQVTHERDSTNAIPRDNASMNDYLKSFYGTAQ